MFSINDWKTKNYQTVFYLPNLLSQILNSDQNNIYISDTQ